MKRGKKGQHAPPTKANRPAATKSRGRPRRTPPPADLPAPPLDPPQAAPPPRLQVYPDDLILDAIRAERGLVTRVAKRLGCSPQTVYTRIKENKELADAVQEERTTIVDTAEYHVFQRIENGSPDDCWRMLRLLGRDRGYAETTNVRVGGDPDGVPLATAVLKQTEYVESLGLPAEMLLAIAEAIERREAFDAAPGGRGNPAPFAGPLPSLPGGPGAAGGGLPDPQPGVGPGGGVDEGR